MTQSHESGLPDDGTYRRTKIPNLSLFGEFLEWKFLVKCMAIWNICGNFKYFLAMWQMLWQFGIFSQFW
jgi:hypothetical protein